MFEGAERDIQRRRPQIERILRASLREAQLLIRPYLPYRTGQLYRGLEITIEGDRRNKISARLGWHHAANPSYGYDNVIRTGKLLGALYGNERFPRPIGQVVEDAFIDAAPRIQRQVERGLRLLWLR